MAYLLSIHSDGICYKRLSFPLFRSSWRAPTTTKCYSHRLSPYLHLWSQPNFDHHFLFLLDRRGLWRKSLLWHSLLVPSHRIVSWFRNGQKYTFLSFLSNTLLIRMLRPAKPTWRPSCIVSYLRDCKPGSFELWNNRIKISRRLLLCLVTKLDADSWRWSNRSRIMQNSAYESEGSHCTWIWWNCMSQSKRSLLSLKRFPDRSQRTFWYWAGDFVFGLGQVPPQW